MKSSPLVSIAEYKSSFKSKAIDCILEIHIFEYLKAEPFVTFILTRLVILTDGNVVNNFPVEGLIASPPAFDNPDLPI